MGSKPDKIYLVRTLDTYDNEWIEQVACLTREDAEEARKAYKGSQTNILPVKVFTKTS